MPFANAQVVVAEVINVSGKVILKTPKIIDWLDLEIGMKVREGDIIKSEEESSAELGFGEELENIIRIFPSTQIIVSRVQPGLIKLDEGMVYVSVDKLEKESTFEVRTPSGVSGAKGTGWGVSYKDKVMDVKGFENTVYVAGLDEAGNPVGMSDLQEGWKTTVTKDEGPRGFSRLSDVETSAWRGWKEEAKGHAREFEKEKAKEQGEEGGEDSGDQYIILQGP